MFYPSVLRMLHVWFALLQSRWMKPSSNKLVTLGAINYNEQKECSWKVSYRINTINILTDPYNHDLVSCFFSRWESNLKPSYFAAIKYQAIIWPKTSHKNVTACQMSRSILVQIVTFEYCCVTLIIAILISRSLNLTTISLKFFVPVLTLWTSYILISPPLPPRRRTSEVHFTHPLQTLQISSMARGCRSFLEWPNLTKYYPEAGQSPRDHIFIYLILFDKLCHKWQGNPRELSLPYGVPNTQKSKTKGILSRGVFF